MKNIWICQMSVAQAIAYWAIARDDLNAKKNNVFGGAISTIKVNY